MGKSTISMAMFNSYVSHNQRVTRGTPMKSETATSIFLAPTDPPGSGRRLGLPTRSAGAARRPSWTPLQKHLPGQDHPRVDFSDTKSA